MSTFTESSLFYSNTYFWFLESYEVYIILPAMGMVSEVLAFYARKPIFGYKAMVFSILGIILGFLV
ncbi:MAG: cbb3-type cytochrome c oxidase subunit I [Chitinophagales bacterium]